jgi:GDP-mannose 6-dehydrogenase
MFHITVLPGTLRSVVDPALRSASGKQLDVDFGIASNPEFLREGTAVNDYRHPPMTVIGASCERSVEMVSGLYEKIEAPLIKTRIETAELVKYSCNAWHAVKVSFANEIGNISKALDVDGQEVMDIFCQDDKLNLSSYYMRPGFAFGGSCLPKDVRALTYQARKLDLDTPLLNSVMDSNERQIQRGFEMVTSKKGRKLGVLGISFKAGTDDLRESPIVELVERLLGKGYDIRIFDRNVRMAGLIGANREYINEKIPHLMQMLVADLDELFSHAETVIVGNGDTQGSEFERLLSDQHDIVDLVRISKELEDLDRYDGICW